MENVLDTCKKIYGQSTRPFGISKVEINEDGKPTDAVIVYMNNAMTEFVECEPKDLLGAHIYEFWPDGNHEWLDHFYRAAYHDEASSFDTVNTTYRRFQSVNVLPIAKGYCCYEVHNVADWLTAIHPAMESVSAGMFLYEVKKGLILLTSPARECCGLEEDYLDVRTFCDMLFEPDVAQRVCGVMSDFGSDSDRFLCEERIKSGRWLRLSISHEAPSSNFSVGFVEDITVLQETERRSALRYQIIESLSSEYYALHMVNLEADRITPYLLRNEVAEYYAGMIDKFDGYSEWLEYYCREYVVDEDGKDVHNMLSRDHLIDTMPDANGDFSVVCKRRFGDAFEYIELRLIQVSKANDEYVLAARNVNQEMKDQMDQKATLQSALSLAQHASEAKTTFLTNISHDFRTPLNSIMGFSNLALDHLNDEKRVRDSLEKILVSSEHLLQLINEILDVSRIESGKVQIEEQPIDLVKMADELRAVFGVQASDAGIDFQVDDSGITHPNVLGDHMRLNQILINTVGNALKYTPSGGVVCVLMNEGGVAPSGAAMFEFIVRDTGCGMSESFIKRIFMPFERDNSSVRNDAEGTGLGMTITKNLIDLLGGSIDVRSNLGVGSEFTITLPMKFEERCMAQLEADVDADASTGTDADADADAGVGAGAGANAAAGAGVNEDASVKHSYELPNAFEGYRALVVDDDELSREIMTEILRDRGFDVEVAGNGDEAVRLVAESDEGHFDVVVMDMRMPKMSGDDATRAIRALARNDVADMPIIAVTADAFEEGHRRAREAGMTAHVVKPLNRKELLSVLGDCLL